MIYVRFGPILFVCVLLAGWFCGASAYASSSVPSREAGKKIYFEHCAECHGEKGEGVADSYDEALYGDHSVEELTRIIDETMPELEEEKVVGEDAARVAAYIYDAFYSPEARARMNPPRIELQRLTIRQYRNAVADLVGSFRNEKFPDKRRGLEADYYNDRRFKSDKKVFDRIDPSVNFEYGEGSPDADNIEAEAFSMRWRGAVLAEETGEYGFIVKTENGFRLWVNGEEEALMDGWVRSENEVKEHKAKLFLIGGRAYPLKLDFFKFKDKTASISLLWNPPHKVKEVISERNLSPERVPEVTVVSTPFPPDDASMGYDRGTTVSKAWDQATTYAAIEVAGAVEDDLENLTGCKPEAEAEDRKDCLKRFAARFAERAFRRPLTEEQRTFFVDGQFEGAKDLETAVKRSVILVLKSPRFLYPELADDPDDGYAVASRLSFGLWDSLPDDELLEAAAKRKLQTREEIAVQAERMVQDPRARSKLRNFFHHWLHTEEGEDISKDEETYPGFNDVLLSDLRTSLELFVEEIVWSERSDFRDLLLSKYLLLNERLAEFYNVERSASWEGEFEKVMLDPDQRAGVLTHPYLLATFAYHKSSSPIHRGVFLTRNIMGRSLKPPPMAIEFMDGRFDPSLTMREKVAELTKDDNCQGCHSIINPLGFSLEHFDAVGRFRTHENEKPIDAISDYITGDGNTIQLTGARDVASFAAENEKAHQGFIRQLFHHVAKQPVGAYGLETLDRLQHSFESNEFHIRKLLADIAVVTATHDLTTTQELAHD